MSRRYAENTKVPADQSRGEITRLLSNRGVERQAWMTGPEGDQLGFAYCGHSYRLSVPRPTQEEATAHLTYLTTGTDYVEREWRRRWRALLLLIKAKLEFAEQDDEFIREFMPYMLTAGGATLEELVNRGAVQEAVGVPLLNG